MGRIAPLHSGLGFRLMCNGSLLLLLVHLCLGDNHTPSHLASLPQIRPVAHFAQGVTLPPHKRRRLPVENSSDEHNPLQASCYRNEHNPLQVSCYPTKERATRRIVALPPWRCYLTTLGASSQPPPSPWPGLPTGFQTEIRLIMAAIRLQVSCNWTNRMATRRITSLPPWHCCLTTL